MAENSSTEPPVPPENGEHGDLPDGLDDHVRRYIERLAGEAASHRHARRAVEAELERVRREHESESQRRDREIAERERAAGRAERDDEVAALRREIAVNAIKLHAAGRFADAEDAVRLLDLDELLAEPDEHRRAERVDQALSQLLEAKPYLARERERERTPLPFVSQGGRSQVPDGRPRERAWLRG